MLDADLTLGLPPAITAATGVDAMVHAIEAFTSKSPNNNPLSRMLAREALRLLGANIETVCRDGKNRQAREAMLLGSMLAVRPLPTPLWLPCTRLPIRSVAFFHIPHGLSNALVLPHVLRFNAETEPGLYDEIAADAFPSLARPVRVARQPSLRR